MNNILEIKSIYSSNQWRLIRYLVLFGRQQFTWVEIADLFEIKPYGSLQQKKKGANDTWRSLNKRCLAKGVSLVELEEHFRTEQR